MGPKTLFSLLRPLYYPVIHGVHCRPGLTGRLARGRCRARNTGFGTSKSLIEAGFLIIRPGYDLMKEL